MVGFRLIIVSVCLCGIMMNVVGNPVEEMQGGKRAVTKVKVCGDQLVNMLRIICSHRGNHKEKRTKPKKPKKKNKKNKNKKRGKGKKKNRSENLTIKERRRGLSLRLKCVETN